MKMTKTHFETLRVLIAGLLEQHPDTPIHYSNGNFARANSVKDLNKRYRWDLFYAATRFEKSFRDELTYLQDSHIDTALRNIVTPIERKF
ncbi:MAG: hypothetical protein CMC15_13460 [Flavobacteriaceae bacterium]|jgi:hypothetical protein|nr:hypothetical protein [Flavobacteriaceae bacterium]